MKQKDQVVMEVQRASKAARTAIRLKHSMAADAEINEVIPRIETEIMAAAVSGKPYTLDVSSLFEGA